MTYSKSSPRRREKNTSKIIVTSKIGALVITACEGRVISISRAKKSQANKSDSDQAVDVKSEAVLRRARQELQEYLAGARRVFSIPTTTHGTEFQKQVWYEMAKIPYGQTVSYRDLAHKVGRPKASRAIGGACGKNPLLILVPCHRVIASSGTLGGFALGLGVKRRLLDIEKR